MLLWRPECSIYTNSMFKQQNSCTAMEAGVQFPHYFHVPATEQLHCYRGRSAVSALFPCSSNRTAALLWRSECSFYTLFPCSSNRTVALLWRSECSFYTISMFQQQNSFSAMEVGVQFLHYFHVPATEKLHCYGGRSAVSTLFTCSSNRTFALLWRSECSFYTIYMFQKQNSCTAREVGVRFLHYFHVPATEL